MLLLPAAMRFAFDVRYAVVAVSCAFAVGLGACGGADGGSDSDSNGGDAGDESGFNLDAGADTTVTIAMAPKTATLDVDEGVPGKTSFKVIATAMDGSTSEVTDGVSWTIDAPSLGSIAAGTFTANGTLGGTVNVRASWKGQTAAAVLLVRLHVHADDATLDDPTKAALKSATAKDGAIQWAYPYDDTVFPRGLAGPTLMWDGGAASDGYRIHIESPTFEYEGFQKAAPPSRVTLSDKAWTEFVESTSGAATLTVQRYAAATSAATEITQLHWTIAPGSMRGTIYYWSNRQGRVLRIKPGAATPDDFSAGVLPTSDMLSDGTNPPAASTCTMTCHSVSADGSTIISGGDVFGGSYDLAANKPRHSVGGSTYAQRRAWNFAAVSPDGKYLVTNGNGTGGLYSTADGSVVAGSGLDGVPTWAPAFSPTGKQLLYLDYGSSPHGDLFGMAFDAATTKFGTKQMLVKADAVAGAPFVGYPSGSPDGKWAVYMRATVNTDTRGRCLPGKPSCEYDNRGNLYLAPTDAMGAETELAKLNGTGYPFAAGARDQSWNFEPTFAPVAAGGYFWVVFTSRRTYGNQFQGALADPSQVKQLWVAAIDPTVTPGKDPSHAAFRLPGQSLTFVDGGGSTQNALNMRGFWALEPCKSDGLTCGAGSDCCGGFCEKKDGSDVGMCRSVPPPCSAEGDKCSSDGDCCGKASGAKCIGGFCSQKPPA